MLRGQRVTMSEPRGRNSRPSDKHRFHLLAKKLLFFKFTFKFAQTYSKVSVAEVSLEKVQLFGRKLD
jgi:hypothetical protein